MTVRFLLRCLAFIIKNETDNKGNTTRYAFNAATLKQSTVAWKNSSAGLFVSTDGGKTMGLWLGGG